MGRSGQLSEISEARSDDRAESGHKFDGVVEVACAQLNYSPRLRLQL